MKYYSTSHVFNGSKVNKFYADTLEKDMSWNEFFSDKVPDHHSGTI